MLGTEFYDVLTRLIGNAEATRCLGKICPSSQLEDRFFGEITYAEALAFYIYSTANGWHTYINEQLWSGAPPADVVAFARVLNSGLNKLAPIRGTNGTVFRGYSASDLDAFATQYEQGQIVTFPGFTSASFKEGGAFGGNVLFIIRALSARAIWFLSPNFQEEEALLPTDRRFEVVDTEYRVVGNQRAKLVLVLQEILRDPR